MASFSFFNLFNSAKSILEAMGVGLVGIGVLVIPGIYEYRQTFRVVELGSRVVL
jgi:hypothetical protein